MGSIWFTFSILSGLLSFASYNIGFALEKKAVKNLPEDIKSKTLLMYRTLITNRLWLTGLFLTIVSIFLYFIALLWAPLSAIAPLSGFGLIVLVIYAHLDLKESLKKSEIVAIFLIVIGISISSYLISKDTTGVNWDEWKVLIISIPSLIVLVTSVFVSLVFAIHTFLKKKYYVSLSFALFAGVASGIQSVFIKGISIWFSEDDWKLNGGNITLHFFLILLTALISTGVLQIAFRKGKVSNIMALYNGVMTILPITFGGLVLKEWLHLDGVGQFFLFFAIFLTIIGIIILSFKHHQYHSDNNR